MEEDCEVSSKWSQADTFMRHRATNQHMNGLAYVHAQWIPAGKEGRPDVRCGAAGGIHQPPHAESLPAAQCYWSAERFLTADGSPEHPPPQRLHYSADRCARPPSALVGTLDLRSSQCATHSTQRLTDSWCPVSMYRLMPANARAAAPARPPSQAKPPQGPS